jgi:hypothetical protein
VNKLFDASSDPHSLSSSTSSGIESLSRDSAGSTSAAVSTSSLDLATFSLCSEPSCAAERAVFKYKKRTVSDAVFHGNEAESKFVVNSRALLDVKTVHVVTESILRNEKLPSPKPDKSSE